MQNTSREPQSTINLRISCLKKLHEMSDLKFKFFKNMCNTGLVSSSHRKEFKCPDHKLDTLFRSYGGFN
jgi:hypothetical protein